MITVEKLLEILEAKYPNQLPTTISNIDMDNICKQVGQQDVITSIRSIVEEDEYRRKSKKR